MIFTVWFIWSSNGNVDMGGLGGAIVFILVWLMVSGTGLQDILKAKKAGNSSKKIKFLFFTTQYHSFFRQAYFLQRLLEL